MIDAMERSSGKSSTSRSINSQVIDLENQIRRIEKEHLDFVENLIIDKIIDERQVKLYKSMTTEEQNERHKDRYAELMAHKKYRHDEVRKLQLEITNLLEPED